MPRYIPNPVPYAQDLTSFLGAELERIGNSIADLVSNSLTVGRINAPEIVIHPATAAYAPPNGAWDTHANTARDVLSIGAGGMYDVIESYSGSGSGIVQIINKSRGAAIGTYTAVQDGDNLLTIQYRGADGATFTQAANMDVQVDGTLGAGIPGRFIWRTSPAGGGVVEHMRLRASGQLSLIGDGSGYANPLLQLGGSDPALAIQGTTNSASAYLARHGNDAFGPIIAFGKSRGANLGTNTLALNGDELGKILWYGADGSDMEPSVQLKARVGTTSGANDMPGEFSVWLTPDGTNALTERTRWNHNDQTFWYDSSGNICLVEPVVNSHGGIMAVAPSAGKYALMYMYAPALASMRGYVGHSGTNLEVYSANTSGEVQLYAVGSDNTPRTHIRVGGAFTASAVGFHSTAPIVKPTVTGSRGANAALASVLTALANYGLIIDSSS